MTCCRRAAPQFPFISSSRHWSRTTSGRTTPSTAVLAAALGGAGLACAQVDLNEALALWLVDTAREPRRGDDLTDTADVVAAAAADIVGHARHPMVDADGRHLFCDVAPGSASSESGSSDGARLAHNHYLLGLMARRLHVDLPIGPELREWLEGPVAHRYREFYRSTGYLQRLADAGGPTMVGISIPMGPQLAPSIVLAEELKRAAPDVLVVLGGPTVSLASVLSLRYLIEQHDAIDLLVRFDGDLPVVQAATQVMEGRWEPSTVGNAVYRQADGRAAFTEAVKTPKLRDLAPAEYSTSMLRALGHPSLGVVQARGCYWGKCAYCDYVELFGESGLVRSTTPAGFLADLHHLLNVHGVSDIRIVTEAIPPGFARRFARAVLDESIDLSWTSFAMVDERFDRPLFEMLRESGCRYLVVGMESMITRVLRFVDKHATQEMNLAFLRDARIAGLPLVINMIPDLPTTTYDEALQSLELFRREAEGVVHFSVFPFEATKSSAIGRDPGRFGLVVEGEMSGDGQAQYRDNSLRVRDDAMSDDQRADVHQRYQAFAEQHNARRGRAAPPVPDAPGFFDGIGVAVDGRGGATVLDSVNRVTVSIPGRLGPVVQAVTASGLSLAVLRERTRGSAGAQLVEKLSQLRLGALNDADVGGRL